MSFPADGSYFTFRLDPFASLQDIEDKQVIQAARRLSVKEYVACLTWVRGMSRPSPHFLTDFQACWRPSIAACI